MFELERKNIVLNLINTEQNKKSLEKISRRQFQNLSVMYGKRTAFKQRKIREDSEE